jgi:hypothetical protein
VFAGSREANAQRGGVDSKRNPYKTRPALIFPLAITCSKVLPIETSPAPPREEGDHIATELTVNYHAASLYVANADLR